MSDGGFGLICKAVPHIQSPGLTERAQASTGLPVWVTQVCERRARRAAAEQNTIISDINYEL